MSAFRSLLILSALLLAPVFGAVAADEIIKLPGWSGPLPSRQYSGFIETNPGRHMHYWFIESESNPATDPVILWVQGGPGASSMIGLFTEMGPFFVSSDSLNSPDGIPTLFRNEYGWSGNANMLYWEAPVGVGFSYCDGGCPHWNDTTSAQDNYLFLCNFFKAYPEFAKNDFYLTGESYAGVYIPTLMLQIMNGTCPINLKGSAIGNGCTGTDVGPCSPGRMQYVLKFLAQQGLCSEKLYSQITIACADSLSLTRPNNECLNLLIQFNAQVGPYNNYNVYDTCGPPTNTFIQQCCDSAGLAWACNIVNESGLGGNRKHQALDGPIWTCGGQEAMSAWLNNPICREAIHMPNVSWPGSGIQYTRTYQDLISVTPSLLSRYRMLIFSGDFDVQIPYIGTEEWTRGLGYPELEGWRPWTLDSGEVGGYVTSYQAPNEFTYLTVRASGHMAPTYRPEESLVMLQRFLAKKPY